MTEKLQLDHDQQPVLLEVGDTDAGTGEIITGMLDRSDNTVSHGNHKYPGVVPERLTEAYQLRLARELAGAALLGDTIFVPRRDGTIIQATLQGREDPSDGAITAIYYVQYKDPRTGQLIEKAVKNLAAISDGVQNELARQFDAQQSVGHGVASVDGGRFGNGVVELDSSKIGPTSINQAAASGSLPLGPDGRPFLPKSN